MNNEKEINIYEIETIKLSSIDDSKKFFHFTREGNIPNILEQGLRGNLSVRENAVGNDYENPAIYFSDGEEGLLKTIDVWIRWEYNRIALDRGLPNGSIMTVPNALKRTYKKIFEDFKDRRYFQLDLVEGNDIEKSDFSHDNIDYKKQISLDRGKPNCVQEWMMGPYTDWTTAKQEDWNMMTHIGGRPIEKERIKLITDEQGRSDAISIIEEVYNRNKDKNLNLRYLDSFMEFIEEIRKQVNNNRCQNLGKDTLEELKKVDKIDKMAEEFFHKESLELDKGLVTEENTNNER